MFIGGITLFTLASLAGGLATQPWWLISCRALQGTGAAFAAPAALSLIAVTFPEGKLRNLALGVYAAMTGIGGAVGLIAGGLLTTYASWRWVFYVNVPLGVLLVLGAIAVIPESPQHARQWDLPGAFLATSGFALLVYGLSNGATGPDGVSHWGDVATIVGLTVASIALVLFVLVEARTSEPLLPLWIFANRNRAGVSDEHSGVASSMFNAGQQVGGAIGLAVIGSFAWTVVNSHITAALGHLKAGQTLLVVPGSAIYDNALSDGITLALRIVCGVTIAALVITIITIRVHKEDLPARPVLG